MHVSHGINTFPDYFFFLLFASRTKLSTGSKKTFTSSTSPFVMPTFESVCSVVFLKSSKMWENSAWIFVSALFPDSERRKMRRDISHARQQVAKSGESELWLRRHFSRILKFETVIKRSRRPPSLLRQLSNVQLHRIEGSFHSESRNLRSVDHSSLCAFGRNVSPKSARNRGPWENFLENDRFCLSYRDQYAFCCSSRELIFR